MAMYWWTNHKTQKYITALNLLGAVIIMQSCQNEPSTIGNSNKEFIDLPAFFQKEIDSLQIAKPLVTKTVLKDSISEQRELHIKDWNIEFSSFLSIDLNKPAYKGYIQKDSINNVVNYKFTNPDLDLNLVKITYENQDPITFEIFRNTDNLLYYTEEHLSYSKGKTYKVEKKQKVTFLGNNFYAIEGLLK